MFSHEVSDHFWFHKFVLFSCCLCFALYCSGRTFSLVLCLEKFGVPQKKSCIMLRSKEMIGND